MLYQTPPAQLAQPGLSFEPRSLFFLKQHDAEPIDVPSERLSVLVRQSVTKERGPLSYGGLVEHLGLRIFKNEMLYVTYS